MLGTDDQGDSRLTYHWSVIAKPAGAHDPRFHWNGSNAAQDTYVEFYLAGPYTLGVTISDGYLSTSSTVDVSVDQSLSMLIVEPQHAVLATGTSQQFTAVGLDQFEEPMVNPPPLTWQRHSLYGTMTEGGLYTSRSSGWDEIVVTSGAVRGLAGVTFGPIIGTIFDDTNANGTRDAGEYAVGGDWEIGIDYDKDGQLDSNEMGYVDGAGTYILSRPGSEETFDVRWNQRPGWQNTTYPGGFFTLTLGPEGVAKRDIGQSGDRGIQFLDSSNQFIDPTTQALSVSNWVTTEGLPSGAQGNGFNDTNVDPDNFRIEVSDRDAQAVPSVSVYIHRQGVRYGPWHYQLGNQGGGADAHKHRGTFLRLVSDEVDNQASGAGATTDPNQQTIFVRLGDELEVTYLAGDRVTWISRKVTVGRPAGENNNDPNDQSRHDIRQVLLNVVVFENLQGTDAARTHDQVWADLRVARERLAQAGIQLDSRSYIINMGWAEKGVPAPAPLQDGGFLAQLGAPAALNEDEQAVANAKDADVNSIDVFYVPALFATNPTTNETGQQPAVSFPKIKNRTGDVKSQNFIVMNGRPPRNPDKPRDPENGAKMFSLAHEIMHILLDIPHRNRPPQVDPDTALFKFPTSPQNTVTATKRIGPYPATANAGNDDTTRLRGSAEALPQ